MQHDLADVLCQPTKIVGKAVLRRLRQPRRRSLHVHLRDLSVRDARGRAVPHNAGHAATQRDRSRSPRADEVVNDVEHVFYAVNHYDCRLRRLLSQKHPRAGGHGGPHGRWHFLSAADDPWHRGGAPDWPERRWRLPVPAQVEAYRRHRRLQLPGPQEFLAGALPCRPRQGERGLEHGRHVLARAATGDGRDEGFPQTEP
mmetsp:Transcript_83470/g.232852  ORF Transcript_83470/g.232852 Transcript_83470/m.232852 type:complete len:200 (-) Transcript_83470:2535-3134(-)